MLISPRSTTLIATASMLVAIARVARADEGDVPAQAVLARDSATDGTFTPGLLSARTASRGVVVAATGYNGSTKQTSIGVIGEATVFGPLRLVMRVDGIVNASARPGAGVGVHWLDEARHGLSSTAYLFYKAEGFTEPEGEIEAVVAFARRLGPLHAALDVAYGQDADAKERDGEAAVLVQAAIGHDVLAGVTGRYRDALGSGGDAGVVRDLFGGATTTVSFGRFGVTAMAGVAAIGTTTASLHAGLSATLAVGAAF